MTWWLRSFVLPLLASFTVSWIVLRIIRRRRIERLTRERSQRITEWQRRYPQ